MGNFIIKVSEEPQLVTTIRESKAVWIAAGEYKGRLLRRNSETEQDAVTQWLESAQLADLPEIK